jgi:quaternary ammonium compound-resistance protein SugE
LKRRVEEEKMPWVTLVLAGVLEIVWAVGLKFSHGFTRLWPSALTLAALAGSLVLLAQSTRSLPLGTAYAVWVGIGSLGAAIAGMVLFREPVTAGRVLFLALLLLAIVGLKLTSSPA